MTLKPWRVRMSWMNGPLAPGEVRNRIGRKELYRLMQSNRLRVIRTSTFLPMGTDGVLWWFNAEGINRIANKIIPTTTLQHLKEGLGLGQFRIVMAQREG